MLRLLCYTLLFTLLQICPVAINAQDSPIYHRAKVWLEGNHIEELAKLGIEVDHGEYAPFKHLINDFSRRELARIREAGFRYDVLIEDVGTYYADPNRSAAASRGVGCGIGITPPEYERYDIPSNFRLGDMAGFYRYDEMLQILDSMRLLFPNLISERAPIEGAQSVEGRPIQWLRISSNPDVDQANKPEVLYTALHHAREPNGLTQMIYFMWYLLENHATSAEIQYLLAETELYFVPCVNPDGYIWNETTDPDGGGLWRKNRRQHNLDTFGVDLNRNYGFEWGFDNSGSSPNPASETYRGTGPFSEPETQAVRDFCEQHEFVVALNYHTYGNLLIYPWGFSDMPTSESTTFNQLASVMTKENEYLAGTGSETVGYVVNGDSDDWMYGEQDTKPAIYSMTPEVGNGAEGFWPAISSIIPNCKASLWMNFMTAHTPLISLVGEDNNFPKTLRREQTSYPFTIRRFGRTAGPVTVTLKSLQADVVEVNAAPLILNLGENENIVENFGLSWRNSNIAEGDALGFELQIDNGDFVRRDTFWRTFTAFSDEVTWTDNLDNNQNWESLGDFGWWLTDEDFTSAPNAMTDSPYERYQDDALYLIELANPLTVGEAEAYKLQFQAKWSIEQDYDYTQLLFRVNEDAWQAACGRYTVLGTENQIEGEPLWDGSQSSWVMEEIDLTPYVTAGDELALAFQLVTDQFVRRDGFYFDDLVLVEQTEIVVNTRSITNEQFNLTIQPNPATQQVTLSRQLSDKQVDLATVEVFAADGTQVFEKKWELRAEKITLLLNHLPSGVYWVRVRTENQLVANEKLLIVK